MQPIIFSKAETQAWLAVSDDDKAKVRPLFLPQERRAFQERSSGCGFTGKISCFV
ncbi:MAG: hypothetical protein R3A12_14230 [Ignavibacteria bacterium]